MDLAKYIGIPYDKVNCFGIVKMFYKNEMGVELKDYFDGDLPPEKKDIEFLIVSNKGDFKEVDMIRVGDILVLKLFGYACHIGVYIGQGNFLHTRKGTGSCIESLSRYQRVIEGIYRHEESK